MSKTSYTCTGCMPIDKSIVDTYVALLSADKSVDEAEEARVEAEAGRVEAETARVSAEASRVIAEGAREATSSADHAVAVSDHTTAVADHTTAEGDHSTATTDHTASVEATEAAGVATNRANEAAAAAEHMVDIKTGPQGPQGNTGSSVDYPYELVNNVTTDDATKGLSAAQGVVLDGKISQLGQKVGIKSGLPKYGVQPDDFVDGLYWYNNSGTIAKLTAHSSYCGCGVGIPVIEGDSLLFNNSVANTAVAMILTDNVGSIVATYNGLSILKLNNRITIPSGVSFVYINTYMSDKAFSYCMVMGVVLKGMLQEDFRLSENIEKKIFTSPDDRATRISEYIFEVNKQYRVTIVGTENVIVYTYDGTTNLETILQGSAGISVLFTPTISASFIKMVAASAGSSWQVEVETGIDKRVTDLEERVEEVEGASSEMERIVDETIFQTGELRVVPSAGGILQDGTYDSNTGFGHFSFSLSDAIIKELTFAKTYVNNATRCCYGFIVDGVWQGFPGNESPLTPASIISVNVPEGASEFRVCWNRNQVSDNDFALSFFGYVKGITDRPKNAPVFQFTPDFILSRVPETIVCPTEQEASDLTLTQLYDKWDGLVGQYPEYITKVDCDAEVQAALSITAPSYMEGLPIYMYKFTPTIGGNSAGVDKTSRVKVLITSMHPQERLGLFTMFETIKMVCENWKNDVNAEQLRSLVDIYVLPCPWPWNFANRSRANYNGVNGNRQFPTKNWEESGRGTPDWSGTAPLSEYEAKVVNYHLLKIKPNVSVDVHTSGNDNVGHMGIFLVNDGDKSLIDLCGVIARTTSNRAIQDNPNFPSSPDKCIYGVYPEDGSTKGEFYEYAYEQGCKYSILSEESPYSKWDDGVFGGTSGPIIEQYTNGILREQVQYLFNTILRLTRQASIVFYE